MEELGRGLIKLCVKSIASYHYSPNVHGRLSENFWYSSGTPYMNLSIDTARVELTASSHSPHSWLFNMLVMCQVEYLEGVGPIPVETKSFRMSKKGIISWVVSIFELTSLIFSRPENKGLFFQNGLLSSIDNLFTGSVGVVDGGEGGGVGWGEQNGFVPTLFQHRSQLWEGVRWTRAGCLFMFSQVLFTLWSEDKQGLGQNNMLSCLHQQQIARGSKMFRCQWPE